MLNADRPCSNWTAMTREAEWLTAHWGPVVVRVDGGNVTPFELRYLAARGWWCSCDSYQYRGTCAHIVSLPEAP